METQLKGRVLPFRTKSGSGSSGAPAAIVLPAVVAKPPAAKRSKRTKQTSEQRFWSQVDKSDATGCWLWLGKRTHNGYGIHGRKLAHRYSFELHGGTIPTGLELMHSCDNRGCVAPHHASPGSRADNMKDMTLKGRAKSKLSPADVAEILALRATEAGMPKFGRRWTLAALAERYGVCKATISHTVTGRNWRHHTGLEDVSPRVIKGGACKRVSPDEARAVYRLTWAGGRKSEIARMFDISVETVERIHRGESHARHTGAERIFPNPGHRHRRAPLLSIVSNHRGERFNQIDAGASA